MNINKYILHRPKKWVLSNPSKSGYRFYGKGLRPLKSFLVKLMDQRNKGYSKYCLIQYFEYSWRMPTEIILQKQMFRAVQ